MRSRALIWKWWPQWVQTLRFSSNSLSKTMFEHLGHLSQRPSGISRLRDLVLPSLGFFVKAVSVVTVGGGGVTAGSAASNPSVFLLKVVAIIQLGSIIHRSTAIHHGPPSRRKHRPRRHP